MCALDREERQEGYVILHIISLPRPDSKGSTVSQQSLASIPTWLTIYYPGIIQFSLLPLRNVLKKVYMGGTPTSTRCEGAFITPSGRASCFLLPGPRSPISPSSTLSSSSLALSRVLHLDHDLWRQRRHGVSQLKLGRKANQTHGKQYDACRFQNLYGNFNL